MKENGKLSEQVTQSLSATNTITLPIKVQQGTYDGIKVDALGGASWLAINEITLGINEPIDLKGQPLDSSAKLNWNPIKDAAKYKVNYGTQSGKYSESITVTKGCGWQLCGPESD